MRFAKLLGTAAIVATLGLAAGCGGDDSSEAEDSPEPSMTTSPALPPSTETAPTPPDSSETDASSAATDSSTAPTDSTAPPSADLTQPPTTYDEARAHIEAALNQGSESSMTRFSTPGDEVYCVLKKSRYLDPSCELLTGAIKDAQVCAQAPSQFVGRVAIRQGRAEPECNTDTIRKPGAETVQPTAVVSQGSIQCAVEPIGVTCVDSADAVGFFLTQGRYEVF